MLCPWWRSIFRVSDFGLRANPVRFWVSMPSAEWMQGGGFGTTRHPLWNKWYLAGSDSNDSSLHLLLVLRDILTFLVNLLWNYRLLRNFCLWKELPSNRFSISAEQATFWLLPTATGQAFALLKGFRALHSIMWTKKALCSSLEVWL